MLENLREGDVVEITLRDKSTVKDVVISMDRDGTTKFKELGYRYRSGMEFHDHPSKKDVVDVKVIGEQHPAEGVVEKLVSDDELVKDCNRLIAENAELKEQIAALELEIDALRADKPAGDAEPDTRPAAPAKRGRKPKEKDEGKENENNAPEQTGDSSETGSAESE